jgi:hypothetical protein
MKAACGGLRLHLAKASVRPAAIGVTTDVRVSSLERHQYGHADFPAIFNSAQLLVQAMAQFGTHGGANLPWLSPQRHESLPLLLMPW